MVIVKIIPLIKNNFVFLKISPFKKILKKNKNYVPNKNNLNGTKCRTEKRTQCDINVTLTKPSVTEDKIFISFPVSFRNLKS